MIGPRGDDRASLATPAAGAGQTRPFTTTHFLEDRRPAVVVVERLLTATGVATSRLMVVRRDPAVSRKLRLPRIHYQEPLTCAGPPL